MKKNPTLYKLCIVCSLLLYSMTTEAQPGIISTIAGTNSSGYNGDGILAVNAQLTSDEGVLVDGAGNIYIADGGNHRIRKINTSGIITTVAGTGVSGNSGDGGQATSAQLNFPDAIALDSSGNLYIDDEASQCIRKVNASGIISTIAGTGIVGFSGDGGPATAAKFNNPSGIAIDSAGNIYITDSNNNRVRKIDISGVITTIAGTGAAAYTGDGGPATAAAINHPSGLTLDAAGNLYIAAWGNHAIRKINTSGIITTIAGTGTSGFSGDGGAATLAKLTNPFSVTLDTIGNLYIADFGNNRVRKIDLSGTITTVAGNGTGGYSGDGGQATLAALFHPGQVSFDPSGNMYIADYYNHRVRKINNNCPGAPTVVSPVSVCTGSSAVLTSSSGTGTLNWYTSSSGGSPVGTGTSFTTPPINGSTFYYVGDSVYGCPDVRAQIIVNANPLPVVNLGADAAFCVSTTLDAGNPGATYIWNNSATTQAITVTSSGTYSVTVTNANGCSASDAITVIINPLPIVNLGNDTTVCGSMILNAGNAGSTYLWNNNSTTQTLNVTSTGSYSVIVTDGNGCTNSDAATITVNPLPNVLFTSILGTICIDDTTYALTATPTGGTFFGVGVGTSSNGPAFDPALSGFGSQTIMYTYTDANGCSDTATQIVNVAECTGIPSGISSSFMNVYPNPTSGMLTIETSANDFTLEVLDILGEQVIYQQNNTGKTSIDLSRMENGIYFIRISTVNGSYLEKVVLQR